MLSNTALTSNASTAATVLRSRANADGAVPDCGGGWETPEGVLIYSPGNRKRTAHCHVKSVDSCNRRGVNSKAVRLPDVRCDYRSTASANFSYNRPIF